MKITRLPYYERKEKRYIRPNMGGYVNGKRFYNFKREEEFRNNRIDSIIDRNGLDISVSENKIGTCWSFK